MGAGLIQLVAQGSQDIYLTGNPQITFFKIVYRRHTNFSMEIALQSIAGNPVNGGISDIKISRIGDLLYKIYIASTSTTDDITNGSAIISHADIEIGGQLIERQTSEWLNIYNELTVPRSKSHAFKYMIGDLGTGGMGTKSGVGMIQVPLHFWFCKSPGLALPLIALQHHDINLKITWGSPAGHMVSAAKVYCDYIYLDVDERKRFAQVSHEYLIEQIQSQSMDGCGKEHLNFNHPIKEIIWTSPNNQHVLGYYTAQLKFNGMPRIPFMESEYFQLRQPLDHHTEIPEQNTHVGFYSSGSWKKQSGTLSSTLTSTEIQSAPMTSGTIGSGNCVVAYSPVILGGNLPIIESTAFTAATITSTLFSNVALIMGVDDATAAGFVVGNIGHRFRMQLFGALVVDDGSKYGTYKGLGGSSYELYGVQFGQHTDTTAGCVDDTVAVISFNKRIFNDTAKNLAVGTANNSVGVTEGFIINNVEFQSLSSANTALTSNMEEIINVYSFALKPEEHQPSGTCNFSRLDNVELEFTGPIPDASHNIYAVNYNILRIMSGMGGLAYNN